MMKLHITHIAALLTPLCFDCGCASIVSRMGFDSRRTAVYPGLVLECRTFVNPDYIQIGDGGPHHSPLGKRMCGRVMCLIDTPFSATIDTLCLPFDIYHAIPKRQAHQPTESAADTACINKEICPRKESLNNTCPSDTTNPHSPSAQKADGR